MEKEIIIRHFSHKKHPLILKKLPHDNHHVNGDGANDNRRLLHHRCDGCRERISLYGEPYCYRCDECDYDLHKSCAEAPLTIHHPLHQKHRLQLLEKPPYEDDVCEVDCCQRHWEDFTYHCSTCKFDIDIICATAADRKEFRHISHYKHPLVLKKLPPQNIIMPTNKQQDHHGAAIINNIGGDGDGDGDADADGVNNYPVGVGLLDHATCKGCFERISLYGEPYWYRCDECEYDLHKVCAEAPLTIHHPLHQEHLLTLAKNPPYNGDGCTVDCCKRYWKDFTYSCYSCDFDVDIICATAGERKVYSPHHNHLLTLFRKPLSAECNACGIEGKGAFYLCTTCVHFCLHEDCALLPKEISIQQTTGNLHHHHHPLALAYGLVQRYAQHSPNCRICQVRVKKRLWLYSCEKCRYFVHLNCAMNPSLGADLNLSETFLWRLFEEEHLDLNLLNLPLEDEFHSLMEQLFLKGSLNFNFGGNVVNEDSTDQATQNVAVINHSVPSHPLVLFDDEAEWVAATSTSRKSILHNPMKKVTLVCNGCVRPVAQTPFYRCGEQQCNDFVLHKWCAELPTELPRRLFHNNHPLMLIPNVPTFFGIFTCKICNWLSNGFAYGCVQCEYYIDIRCAFMPKSIKHEAHPEHVLHLRVQEQADPTCHGCHACWLDDCEWMFHCDECKFRLCSDCAQLPKTMRHKYDKHPLRLMYLPPEDHISQYFCDICEKEDEMDPDRWFYHCADCDQQMHVRCSSIRFGIKCGGFITIDPHPHRLTFAEWRTESNITCNECEDSISFGFRCVECKYALHWYCASEYISPP